MRELEVDTAVPYTTMRSNWIVTLPKLIQVLQKEGIFLAPPADSNGKLFIAFLLTIFSSSVQITNDQFVFYL